MPSSELAEYLLHDYIRAHLSIAQQSALQPLLTQWQIAVRTENDRRSASVLAQFVDKLEAVLMKLDALEASDAEQDGQLTRLTNEFAALRTRIGIAQEREVNA